MSDISSYSRVTLTESAAGRVKELIAKEGNAALMLRLGVAGGGCSGFQYGIGLDDKLAPDDVVFEQHGVKLVVDQTSLELVSGTEIDFVEDLAGSAFQFHNPRATSTCGCGSSFGM